MGFKTQRTSIGLYLIKPDLYPDPRGFFSEVYKKSSFPGFPDFPQDNLSFSKRGVIRGLHYQVAPSAQGKLVRAITGRVYDVAVDVREGSGTLGKWEAYELSPDGFSVYIPPGFAHGFQALEEGTAVLYKVTAEYDKSAERGIRYDDPDLGIPWPIKEAVVSDKDKGWPRLRDADLMRPEVK